MPAPVLQVMTGGCIPLNIEGIKEVNLVRMLGAGGFGSVWEAVDTKTNKKYALKIIQGVKPGSVDAERVRLEAGVRIASEHIVPAIGLREWDPSTFLILFEYFQGKALDDLLTAGTLSKEQKRSIFHQALTAVADAHRCNVVHRDLKPANILVADDGRVKLIDFGISKFKGSGITVSGEIIGTIPYIAPELLFFGAKVADARADIFSLGHILYELAMGQHFWARKGWRELKDLVGYLSQTPPPTEAVEMHDFRCDFYKEAHRILPQMIKIDPEKRCRSVDHVIAALGFSPALPEIPKDLHLRHPLLIVESGSNKGAQTVLSLRNGGLIRMGRVDIAGNDVSISREHLEFSRIGDQYFVRDCGSKNGTMASGVTLKSCDPPIEIKHGDRIKVGDIFLRLAFLLKAV